LTIDVGGPAPLSRAAMLLFTKKEICGTAAHLNEFPKSSKMAAAEVRFNALTSRG
jgi:hypothetical protein